MRCLVFALVLLAGCVCSPPYDWELRDAEALLTPVELDLVHDNLRYIFRDTDVTFYDGPADLVLRPKGVGEYVGFMRCLPDALGGCDGWVAVDPHRESFPETRAFAAELANTIAHEIGHAFGLEHDPGSPLMAYIRPGDGRVRDFLPWELEAFR